MKEKIREKEGRKHRKIEGKERKLAVQSGNKPEQEIYLHNRSSMKFVGKLD